MSKVIFEEKQAYRQWWMLLLIIASISIMGYFALRDFNPEEPIRSLILIFIIALAMVFILAVRLKTRIDETGIHVQFFPLHLKVKSYLWENIYSAEVLKYSPLMEYGGWGYRVSTKGKAFSVSGSQGIKVVTDEGKTRMIGTQKPDEARKCIEQYLIEKKA